MRVAVPEQGGLINPHFGKTTSFTLIDLNNTEIVSVNNIEAINMSHQYKKIAELLQANHVDVVIVGSINQKCFETLNKYGFLVISGIKGDINSAVTAYARGELFSYEHNCACLENCIKVKSRQ